MIKEGVENYLSLSNKIEHNISIYGGTIYRKKS